MIKKDKKIGDFDRPVLVLSSDDELVAAVRGEFIGADMACDAGRGAGDVQHGYHVLVLDSGCGAQAVDVARVARTHNPRVLIVGTGDETSPSVLIEMLRIGAVDWLEKTAGPRRIAAQVRALYERSVLGRFREDVSARLRVSDSALEFNQEELQREIVRSNEELQAVNQRLQRVASQLRTLYHMGRDLADNENWSDALDRFLMALVSFMEAEGAALILFSEEGKTLRPRSSFQFSSDVIEKACETVRDGWENHPRVNEIHALESYRESRPGACLERAAPWRYTTIPLRHRNRALGFLLLEKPYADGASFKWDYDFLNTLQTIFVEEISNASYISELRQLSRFNNKVLDNIRSGVVTTNLEGHIQYCNDGAQELCPRLGSLRRGRGSAPIHFDTLFRSAEIETSFFSQIIESTHDSYVMEVECLAGGAEPFPVRLRTAKMLDDNLNGIVVVAIFEDLTEQKRMETEIRRNDRLRVLGQLSAGVAHEIRNPLTGIATTAEVLGEKLGDDEEKRRYIRTMLDEINRLDEIIRSLLNFARPPRPQLAPCEVAGVAEKIFNILGDQAEAQGIALRILDRDADMVCEADGGQLAQVLLNLTLNAIQAGEPGGTVEIGFAAVPSGAARGVVRIEVSDDGRGVPPSVRDNLFDPFVTTKTQGTGLGLAICRQIMEDHGGTIDCEFLPRGTRFVLELPRAARPVAVGGRGQA